MQNALSGHKMCILKNSESTNAIKMWIVNVTVDGSLFSQLQAAPLAAGTHRAPSECKLDGVEFSDRAPDFGNQTLLGHIYIAQVQGVVDGLHLPHFDEPDTDVLSSCLQNPLAVILCLIQNL